MPYTHTRFKLTRCCRSSLSFIHGGASLFAHHLMKYEGQKAVNSYIRLPDTHRGVKKKRGDGNHCPYNKRHISITLTQTCFNIMSIWNVLVRLTEMFLWKMVDILLLSRRSHGRPDTEVTKQTSAPNSSASSVSSHSRILLAARKAQP